MKVLLFISLTLLAVLLLYQTIMYIAAKINSRGVFGTDNGTYRVFGVCDRILIRRKK